ncbi:hypothetical protein SELMODRAFT_417595 [Selaginella moellendorffii]|uniref:Uncharacterized protein n=1 Tax=Selaginella moellendorffii TaxID=88036 RepID=D8S2Y9_SELML|nr:hypothetical protein SELMODRAFT_417595 [Selaginella moellendorffii]
MENPGMFTVHANLLPERCKQNMLQESSHPRLMNGQATPEVANFPMCKHEVSIDHGNGSCGSRNIAQLFIAGAPLLVVLLTQHQALLAEGWFYSDLELTEQEIKRMVMEACSIFWDNVNNILCYLLEMEALKGESMYRMKGSSTLPSKPWMNMMEITNVDGDCSQDGLNNK